MDPVHRARAESIRARLSANGPPTPAAFRAALLEVPPVDRDAWLDLVLALDEIPDDGPALPRGCVPYLPCAVEALLRLVDAAEVGASDVFVDVGAGVGRAAAFVHLVTGAAAIGIEIQPALVDHSRRLEARLGEVRVAPVEGDATALTGFIMIGSVFFLYCPFGGARLERVLDDLEEIARTRTIRVCSVDLPLPSRPWLRRLSSGGARELDVYRSTLR